MELNQAAFLLISMSCTLIGKLYLFIQVITTAFRQLKTNNNSKENIDNENIKAIWFLVGLIIFCSIFHDVSWACKLTRKIFFPSLEPYPFLMILRVAWIFSCLEYLTLSLFIGRLTNKPFKYTIWHWITMSFFAAFALFMTYIAVAHYYVIDAALRQNEYLAYKFNFIYVFAALVPALALAWKKSSQNSGLPRILRHQAKVLIMCLFGPHLFLLALSVKSYIVSIVHGHGISPDDYIFVGLNNIFFTIALYYCANKMLGLRFLNINNHVQAPKAYNFIYDFKGTLQQFSHVTSTQELQHITKNFFARAFNIEAENTQLYIRELDTPMTSKQEFTANQEMFFTSPIVERILATKDSTNAALLQHLTHNKILIRDEIEFDHFYQENPTQRALIELLEGIDATIFLPLYEKETLVAYIIVRNNTRPHKLFSNIERDEMLVFASYLSAIIYLLRHRNLKALIQHEKELREELYLKHQEIHHYKETIRSLLKTHTAKKIGVIYFKNRVFTLANQAARDILQVRTSGVLEAHYQETLKKLALDVKKYGSERKINLQDAHGNQLICAATLGADKNQVLMLIFYPDIADTFTIPFETLKDLSAWDYAIYLETTRSGQLVNQLIPSSSEAMLNFKIDLLKAAFSKEPAFIELPDHDILPVVQILHHISLRTIQHTIELKRPEESQEIALQLFGIEPMLSLTPQDSLLEKLSDTGTIFIQNIEYLALETQNQLLNFFNSGMFQPVRSDRKKISNVRIICSSNKNLDLLVQQGNFSAELLKKLKKTALSLPSLLTIPQSELSELAQRFSSQAIKNKEINSLMMLDEKETHKIIDQRPTSLYEFKERVHSALLHKSSKKKLDHIVEFNPAYFTTDPEIADAVKLGKHALKDKYIMRLLWNKFQNQTKIATLLNVNRSSVNRRCKEFELIGEQE